MTTKYWSTGDVQERAKLVRARLEAGDATGAELAEETMWYDLLVAIADGRCLDPKACARIAVSARNKLGVPRHMTADPLESSR